MLQLKNTTPFAAEISLFPNEQGIDSLYTVIKATFKIGQAWTLCEKQIPPVQQDIFFGEPGQSSLRFASDIHTGKASTDILMAGFACAPEQKPAYTQDVTLSVGQVSKSVRVFGDRFWDNDRISSPMAFTQMPLIYERAFGGQDIDQNGLCRSAELRNPVGVGYCGKKREAEINQAPLPNIECIKNLIQTPRDTPPPACFSPVSANWVPRTQYAGTYDDTWKEKRAPYLPLDYSPRFMNVAHPELCYPGFLQGGEPVHISGMHPTGEIRFNLPYVNLGGKIVIGNQEVAPQFLLETVSLDPNQLQLSMVWRSAYAIGKNVGKVKQIVIGIRR